MAANWKSADKETKDYCRTIARIVKERHNELSKVENPPMKTSDTFPRNKNGNNYSYDDVPPDNSDEEMLGEWIYHKFSQTAKLANSNNHETQTAKLANSINHETCENSYIAAAAGARPSHSILSPDELRRVQSNEATLMSNSTQR